MDYETVKAQLKKYENQIIEKLDTYDNRNQRLFDVAYKAVHSEECNHAAENTDIILIQDYAMMIMNKKYSSLSYELKKYIRENPDEADNQEDLLNWACDKFQLSDNDDMDVLWDFICPWPKNLVLQGGDAEAV
jgi:hypothetical protein